MPRGPQRVVVAPARGPALEDAVLQRAADRGIDGTLDVGMPVQQYVHAAAVFSSANPRTLVPPRTRRAQQGV